jgi:alginate O-acetyltransferase complex protein AlgI
MLLNSFSFVIFFAALFGVFYLVPAALRKYALLLGNLLFLVYAGPVSLIALLLCLVVTFISGLQIAKARATNAPFYAGLFCLLGVLAYFKYAAAAGNTATTDGASGIPLGISYITFQALAYLVDLKQRKYESEKSPIHFTNYLLFFSKVQAGPIERPQHMLPQLRRSLSFEHTSGVIGMRLFLWGMFKKFVVANNISAVTAPAFVNPAAYSGLSLFLVMLYYSFQLYADFSGYTDMARGTARMLGIDLAENFNRPFISRNITEFWRRWHISLSSWFNEYVFTPLTVETRAWGMTGILFSLITTFTLVGLWHGASINFLLFGALHGLAIAIELITQKRRKKIIKKLPGALNGLLGITYSFLFLSITMVLYNVNSITGFLSYFGNMFSNSSAGHKTILFPFQNVMLLTPVIILLFVEFAAERPGFKTLFSSYKPLRWAGYVCLLGFLALLGQFHSEAEFIYVHF